MDIKPIETIYNGYRFRSRLEARWAVFFNALGIKYEYEPEGFDIDKGIKYLPDFYLPDFGIYVEVKPPHTFDFIPTEDGYRCDNPDAHKYMLFASKCSEMKKAFLIVQGDPYDAFHYYGECHHETKLFYFGICEAKVLTDLGRKITCVTGESCNKCERGYEALACCSEYFAFKQSSLYCYVPEGIVPVLENRNNQLIHFYPLNDNDDFSTYEELPDIIHNMWLSAETARKARFEHGECG